MGVDAFLGFPIVGGGWVALIVVSMFIWIKATSLANPAKTFLNIALVSFYVLGYTSTAYWLGQPWLVGLLPAFIAFVIMLFILVKTVNASVDKNSG